MTTIIPDVGYRRTQLGDYPDGDGAPARMPEV